MKNNFWLGFAFGINTLFLLIILTFNIANHFYHKRMYASSPRDIVENWTEPAYVAGAKSGDASRYKAWFEKEYQSAMEPK